MTNNFKDQTNKENHICLSHHPSDVPFRVSQFDTKAYTDTHARTLIMTKTVTTKASPTDTPPELLLTL